mgnify:CR=1 FL=1
MSIQGKNTENFHVEDYLEAVLDNFHDGIYITDCEANTVYLNHSYELISGLRIEARQKLNKLKNNNSLYCYAD